MRQKLLARVAKLAQVLGVGKVGLALIAPQSLLLYRLIVHLVQHTVRGDEAETRQVGGKGSGDVEVFARQI
eukprot:767424-Hanusia_phi.AAC.12